MKRFITAIMALAFACAAWAGPTDPNDIRVTQNNIGSPTFTARPGQEVLL